jgi:hypothetical protein
MTCTLCLSIIHPVLSSKRSLYIGMLSSMRFPSSVYYICMDTLVVVTPYVRDMFFYLL